MQPGKFIVFEGLDGSGTSTQVRKLCEYLDGRDVPVEVTREPTRGPLGAVIRLAIEGRVELDPAALALAFAADRVDHLENRRTGVLERLRRGRWIVSDRYVLSSLAYQGAELSDLEWVSTINRGAVAPDLTVFLDTPPEVCIERIAARSSLEELFHDRDKLERIAEVYRAALAQDAFTGSLVVVDGTLDPDAVFRSFEPQVAALLP
jgi:dTMP kinase